MGLNLLGPKQLRQLRARTGEPDIDRAYVQSHHEHWVRWWVTSDHRHGWYDIRTGEHEVSGPDEEWCVSSCERFPDYTARREAQRARTYQ